MTNGYNTPIGVPIGLPSILSLGLPPLINPYPTLNLDFIENSQFDSRITFSRGSQATLFNSTGALVYAPNNVIRNNTMQGAVAGTPGTLPTNWVTTLRGLTQTVVGTGTQNGITYIDLRFNGTTTSSGGIEIKPDGNAGVIAATASQAWAMSSWVAIVGGSTANTTGQRFIINEYSAGPTYLRTAVAATNVLAGGATLTRVSGAITTGASTTIVEPIIILDAASGVAIDITLRIGMPQLEIGSVATAVNATSGTAYYGPRFDYNPSTLQPRGLLIEEQRTNSIRNNTMQGAVAGTPGTLPTNWFVYTPATGLTTSVVGTGTDNGISYIDVRVTGTASGGGNIIWGCDSNTGIAASNGQTWAQSTYLKIQGGTTTGIVDFRIQNDERSVSAYIRTNASSALPLTTAALNTQRYSFAATLSGGGTVAYIVPYVLINFTVGVAIDITLRIGLPQLEQGAFATSVIPTTTTALTRNADVASMTGTNFSSWYNASEGTFLTVYSLARPSSGSNQFTVRASDNGYNNSVAMNNNATGFAAIATASGGVFDGVATAVTPLTANVAVRFIGCYATNDLAVSLNGAAVVTDTSATIPTGMTRLDIGSDHAGVNRIQGGYIQRISYYPVRLPDSTLQALTA